MSQVLALLLIVLLLYFLPTIVAFSRRVTARGMVIVINVLLGWTFVGWVVALVMAFGSTEQANTGAP